jgi:hypothetical protein
MDTPETLAADMLKAAAEAVAATRTVVQVGAFNVKRDAKANVYKSAPIHNAHAAEAITYDTKIGARRRSTRRSVTTRTASFGPDRQPAGVRRRWRPQPPHRDLGRALDAEEPRFTEALAALVEKLL